MKKILLTIIYIIGILIWILIGIVVFAWFYVKPFEETRGVLAFVIIFTILDVLIVLLKLLSRS